MNSLFRNLLAAAAGAVIIPSAQAGIIAQWNFDNSFATGNPVTVTSPAVTGWNSSALTTAQSASWHNLSSPQGGASGGYMQVSGLQNGQAVSLFDLKMTPTTTGGNYTFTINYASSVNSKTASSTWTYSTDGGSHWTAFGNTDGLGTAFQSFSDSVTINNVGAAGVWFRDTVTANHQNANLANFDSFSIDAAQVVPEPTHYALAAFGLILVGTGTGRWYYRRMQRA